MRIRLEYRNQRVVSPLTPFVHKGVDAPFWRASSFDPPLPQPIPGKGWPAWVIDHRGRELLFASPQEIEHAIEVLSQKSLPPVRRLGQAYRVVNGHWLSRLHASFKPWKVRQDLVKRLRQAPSP